jgi:predicted DNA-binding transcriptional regulator AlpA
MIILAARMGTVDLGGWLELRNLRFPRKLMMGGKTRITSAQIRAARGLLNWSARQLSQQSGVSQSTIHRAETAEAIPRMHKHGLAAIKSTLEQYGIEFLDDSGVRLRFLNGRGIHASHTIV